MTELTPIMQIDTCVVREQGALEQAAQVFGPKDVVPILMPHFAGADREKMIVVLLNTANKVTGLHIASIGGLASSMLEPRQVFKAAVLGNAAGVIVAHNHPSGNLEPSETDMRMTRQLMEAGIVMGIPVMDHLIIGEGGAFTSLAERGLSLSTSVE